jgi:hypothetical protein
MTVSPLLGLQALLESINDAPVQQRVTDFLIDDAQVCSALLGRQLAADEDEQVLICETESGPALSVYIDERVMASLYDDDPLTCLSDTNLAAFCSAVEGISHFQYLIWCVEHARQVSLLELELQAEVDKYAAATCLLMRQAHGQFHRGLHRRLFSQIGFVATLDEQDRHRYSEANRCAANFCRRNDERYLSCRQPRVERWLGELRELFRCSHHQKLRRALC